MLKKIIIMSLLIVSCALAVGETEIAKGDSTETKILKLKLQVHELQEQNRVLKDTIEQLNMDEEGVPSDKRQKAIQELRRQLQESIKVSLAVPNS
ncbi:MAG: hypothetical protein IE889_04465 [Campylobacterales bacterium]|nr:hypothetical protein [Campylobacterales bacterium]